MQDAGDPVEIARRYDHEGADELVFLDITASIEERPTLFQVVEAVAEQIYIPLTVGGGVKQPGDVRALLSAGADKVAINTAAVENPDLVTESGDRYGVQCIVVAIDAKRVKSRKKGVPPRWEVFTHGGRRSANLDAIEWAKKAVALGAAMFAATAAGLHPTVSEAQRAMSAGTERTYRPDPEMARTYAVRYKEYLELGSFVERELTH